MTDNTSQNDYLATWAYILLLDPNKNGSTATERPFDGRYCRVTDQQRDSFKRDWSYITMAREYARTIDCPSRGTPAAEPTDAPIPRRPPEAADRRSVFQWPDAAYVGLTSNLRRRIHTHSNPQPKGTGILAELALPRVGPDFGPLTADDGLHLDLTAWYYPTRILAAAAERHLYWCIRQLQKHQEADHRRQPTTLLNQTPPYDAALARNAWPLQDVTEFAITRTVLPGHLRTITTNWEIGASPPDGLPGTRS